MINFSRRGTFKLAAAATATSLLPVREAKAFPVSAVLAVASAGFELHKLSQGGGGGVASLLAAQTRMLRAISEQLSVIGNVVTQIYVGINDLKDLVTKLPAAASVQIARDRIRNSIENGAGLLRDIDVRTSKNGADKTVKFFALHTQGPTQ